MALPKTQEYKELEVEKEKAATMANFYRARVDELVAKRNEDAIQFGKIKQSLMDTGRALVAEEKARIAAEAVAITRGQEMEALRAQLVAAEVLNASYAAKAMREAESCRSHQAALEDSKTASLELETNLKTAELEVTKLKESTAEQGKFLDDTKEELDNAKRENARLRKGLDTASAKNLEIEGDKKSLQAANQSLIKDLSRQTRAREENYKRWEESEAKLKLCLYCLEFLAPVRRRWMLFPLQTREYDSQMEAGNRAAHWPKLLVDIALFYLGLFQKTDKAHFERMYRFEMRDFVGLFAALQPLVKTPTFVDLVDMRGAMLSFFGLGGPLSISTVDQAFLESETVCKNILQELEDMHGSKQKARVAYAASPTAKVEHGKMQDLVRQMHILHKTRHNRQQDPA